MKVVTTVADVHAKEDDSGCHQEDSSLFDIHSPEADMNVSHISESDVEMSALYCASDLDSSNDPNYSANSDSEGDSEDTPIKSSKRAKVAKGKHVYGQDVVGHNANRQLEEMAVKQTPYGSVRTESVLKKNPMIDLVDKTSRTGTGRTGKMGCKSNCPGIIKGKGGNQHTADAIIAADDLLSDTDEDDDNYKPDFAMPLSSEEETDLSEDEECRTNSYLWDVDNPNIFIIKPVSETAKTKRVQNQKHACLVCGKMVMHIGDHIKIHKGVKEVDEILAHKENKKPASKDQPTADAGKKKKRAYIPRLSLQELYRNRGDHRHNMAVLRDKKGELIVSRRPTRNFKSSDFGPCPKCYLWLTKINLPKHIEKCVAGNKDDVVKTASHLAADSDIIADRIPIKIGAEMKKHVLGRMRNDDAGIYHAVKGDALILMLGRFWWRRSKGHDLNRRRYVSEKMRRAARLLLCVRGMLSEASHISMWDLLRPRYFDTITEAAFKITTPDGQGSEDYMKCPSAAIKVRHDLSRMCREKANHCAKKADEVEDEFTKKKYNDMKTQAESFGKTVLDEWQYRVSILAETMLTERQLDKIDRLPDPDDLLLINRYLIEQCSHLDLSIDDVSDSQFFQNCKVVMTRLYIFNRRRPIEVAGILVNSYLARSTVSNVDDVLIGRLSKSEHEHFSSLDMLKTRGKGNQHVPVLIPPECHHCLDWISDPEVRKQAGIKCKYLFASGSQLTLVMSPNQALKEVAEEAGAKYPERLGGHSMRYYIATLTQTMSLTEFQFQHVLRHFGHTKQVHMQNYRLAAPAVERLEVGKILIMQDRNVQHLFKDRELSTVTFEEILKAGNDEELPNMSNPGQGEPQEDNETVESEEEDQSVESEANFGVVELEEGEKCGLNREGRVKNLKRKSVAEDSGSKKKVCRNDPRSHSVVPKHKISGGTCAKKKRRHESWNTLLDELHTVFKQCYDEQKTPSRRLISKLLGQKNASMELRARGTERILKKISADLSKMKKAV